MPTKIRVMLDGGCVRGPAREMVEIVRLLHANTIEWPSSTVLEAETSNNPDPEPSREVQVLLLLATSTIPLDRQIIARAKGLEAVGCGAFDALHLSSA
jgi:hypothetical protein